MTKKMLVGVTVLATMATLAFFKNPEAGQTVLIGLFNWIWPW